jgi:hypothetical protein
MEYRSPGEVCGAPMTEAGRSGSAQKRRIEAVFGISWSGSRFGIAPSALVRETFAGLEKCLSRRRHGDEGEGIDMTAIYVLVVVIAPSDDSATQLRSSTQTARS